MMYHSAAELEAIKSASLGSEARYWAFLEALARYVELQKSIAQAWSDNRNDEAQKLLAIAESVRESILSAAVAMRDSAS